MEVHKNIICGRLLREKFKLKTKCTILFPTSDKEVTLGAPGICLDALQASCIHDCKDVVVIEKSDFPVLGYIKIEPLPQIKHSLSLK